MGFVKDLFRLGQLGYQEMDRMDVKSRLAEATNAMDQLNASMATLSMPTQKRVSAMATVATVRQTGTFVNYNPLVELSLMVMMPGGVPRPVSASVVIPQVHLARVQPGAALTVNLDPSLPASLQIEW